MIQTLKELQKILADTALKDCAMAKLPILDTGEIALALEINAKVIESSWKIARAQLPATGRWPLVTTGWSGKQGTLEERIADEDPFSRFYFEEAPNTGDVRPRALIAASQKVDVAKFLKDLRAENEAEDDLADLLTVERESTQLACGKTPSTTELEQARINGDPIRTRSQLDRWLLEWELMQGCQVDPSLGRQEWFQPDQAILLFLPTVSSWEALAYLSFYGAYQGAEKYIALGKTWEQRFGTQLVAHYGTMLQCLVARPPPDARSAWTLALEHDLVAPCTLALPGIALRHYAAGLAKSERWFLHERP